MVRISIGKRNRKKERKDQIRKEKRKKKIQFNI
jgi:hypothetical protein